MSQMKSKSSLAMAYSARRQGSKKAQCPDCMAAGGMCYAHGGEVSNPELEMSGESAEMAPHELVDQDMRGSEDSSDDQKDMPTLSEALSLSGEVMKDRKRRMMARGGMVSSYEDDSESNPHKVGELGESIDAPSMSDMDHDKDEMDAPEQDGRDSRGLDLEPVHTMEDDEHDTSDASLVSQILKDRKKRRMGM